MPSDIDFRIERMNKKWDVILSLDFMEIIKNSSNEEDYIMKIRQAREHVEQCHDDILSITPALTDAFNHLTNPVLRNNFFIEKSVERCFGEWNVYDMSKKHVLIQKLEKNLSFHNFDELKGNAYIEIKEKILEIEKPPVLYRDWPKIDLDTYKKLTSQENAQVKKLEGNKVEITFPNSGQTCYIPFLRGDLVYRCTINGSIENTASSKPEDVCTDLNPENVFESLFLKILDKYPNIQQEDHDMYRDFFKNDIKTFIQQSPNATVDEIVEDCIKLFEFKLNGFYI